MTFWKKIKFLAIGFSRPILSLLIIYVTYLLIGSLCFVKLEYYNEMENQNKSTQIIRLTKDMVRVLRVANHSDDDIRTAFFSQHANIKRSTNSVNLVWHQLLGEKLFFAFVLISTIGYGNVIPKSMLGQCICVVFTFFGLPIHAIMMRLLSVKFRDALRKTYAFGLRLLPGSRMVLVAITVFLFLFWLAVLLFIPSYVIMMKENWEYNEAFYFSFVSLTTIGLGDFVAGVPEKEGVFYTLNILLEMIWLFFGLGFTYMAVNMLSYIIGVYTLDKLDCKCRQRSAARRKLRWLLDLMKELNWQLVKGKPDDFENWDDIEDFRNLLNHDPQEVTLQMLQRILGVITDLKEKAYDEVSRTQLFTIPTSPKLERAKNKLAGVLSLESHTSSETVFKDKEGMSKTIFAPRSLEQTNRIPEGTEDRSSASQKDLTHTGSFEQGSSLQNSQFFTPSAGTDVTQRDIIEDKRYEMDNERKTVEDDEKDGGFSNPEEKK